MYPGLIVGLDGGFNVWDDDERESGELRRPRSVPDTGRKPESDESDYEEESMNNAGAIREKETRATDGTTPNQPIPSFSLPEGYSVYEIPKEACNFKILY